MNRGKSTIVALLVFLSMSILGPVHGADGCGFGNSHDYPEYVEEEDGYYTSDGSKIPNFVDWMEENAFCAPTKWDFESNNDGFDKSITIEIWSDSSEDDNSTSVGSTIIYCTKKKIYVNVRAEHAYAVGWNGSGQVRFDKGSAKTFSYYLDKSFGWIQLKDSTSFMKNLVKSKSMFTFKIQTINGSEIFKYPKANISEYRTKFKKAGCAF